MNLVQSVLSALGGFIFGALAVQFLAQPAEPPTPKAVAGEPVQVLPKRDCPSEAPTFNAIGGLQDQLAEREQALKVVQAQEQLATGKPLEWPDDLPEGFDEASIEAVFGEIAEANGGTVLGIDCGEYPCVAVMAWRGENFDQKGAAHSEVWDTWAGAVGGGDTLMMGSGAVDGHAFAIGFTPEGTLTDEQRERVQFRAREAKQIFDAHGFVYPDGVPEPEPEPKPEEE